MTFFRYALFILSFNTLTHVYAAQQPSDSNSERKMSIDEKRKIDQETGHQLKRSCIRSEDKHAQIDQAGKHKPMLLVPKGKRKVRPKQSVKPQSNPKQVFIQRLLDAAWSQSRPQRAAQLPRSYDLFSQDSDQKEQKDEKDALYALMPDEQKRVAMKKSLDEWLAKKQSYIELTPDCELKDFYTILNSIMQKIRCEKEFESIPTYKIAISSDDPYKCSLYHAEQTLYLGYINIEKVLIDDTTSLSAYERQSRFRSLVWDMAHELAHAIYVWGYPTRDLFLKKFGYLKFINLKKTLKKFEKNSKKKFLKNYEDIEKNFYFRVQEIEADRFATDFCYRSFNDFNPLKEVMLRFEPALIIYQQELFHRYQKIDEELSTFFDQNVTHPSDGYRKALAQKQIEEFAAIEAAYSQMRELINSGKQINMQKTSLEIVQELIPNPTTNEQRELRKKLKDLLETYKKKLNTDLLLHAANGNLDSVEADLKNGAFIDHQNQNGETALMLAILKEHEPVVRLLLDCKASVNLQSKNGNTALTLATNIGNLPIAQLLIDHKATVNFQGNSALVIAASRGHASIVQFLLDHKTAIDQPTIHGDTALMLAADNGYTSVVQLLLDRKATVDLQNNNGHNALMLAAGKGHIQIVQLLLDHPAAVNLKTKKNDTALTIVVSRGYKQIAQLLLNYKADVNHKATNGYTALMIAALLGRESVVQLLLDRGADITITNNLGKTALMLAQENGHHAIAALLAKHQT